MANFSKLVITDTGTRLLNRKLHAQEELVFTEMVMSERKYDTALEGLTELEDIRQRTGIRKMEKDEKGVRIGSVFLNSDLEEGYFANTLGLYARCGEDAPVLFAVAAEQTRAAFMPGKSQTLCGMEVRLKITLENTDHITIQMDQSGMATVGDVLELENSIRDHMGNGDNPHHTTKEQVGLGNADDTSDLDKPVSTAQQGAIDAAYQQAAGYTDARIAQLINGAPGTLDTLGEIAQAMQENDTVVDALEQAMGTKASQAEVDGHTGNSTIHITASERQSWNGRQTMTGDTKDNTVSFTSGDAANPTGWTDVELMASGEKHDSLWRKVSLFAKNARYLWKLLGSTSLAGIGDGTVTGAISALNTGLGYIRVDTLFDGYAGHHFDNEWGGVDIYQPYTNYNLLAFVNAFGSCSIVQGNRPDINICLTFNANGNIYIEAMMLSANTTTHFVVRKRDSMAITSEAKTVFYPNTMNAIVGIYGVRLK